MENFMQKGMACINDEEERKAQNAIRNVLESEQKPLAFSSDSELIGATSRIVVDVKHITGPSAILNVEVFSLSKSTSASPLVIFIPGICESTETTSVQNLVKYAADIGVRVAVIELEGHGLSSGGPCLCSDFDRLLQQVLSATSSITSRLLEDRPNTPYILCGSSMGGTLALYAAEHLSSHLRVEKDTLSAQSLNAVHYEEYMGNLEFSKGLFSGVASISPALGVKSESVPPLWITSMLKVASLFFPSSQVPFTPYEDPSSYNCPSNTTRNFKGYWPLATSKMLLDLTSERIPSDIKAGRLQLCHVPRVMIIFGEKDHFIPLEDVENAFNQMQAPKKDIEILKKAGHDVLIHPKQSPEAMELIFSTLV